MNDSLSYKTVFLLDCSNSYRTYQCGHTFEIDVLNKNRQTSGIIPHGSISKSLYTCAVEAIFEFSRIVWDLFPNGERMIKLSCCLSDFVRPINTWEVSQQNYESLLDLFTKFSVYTRQLMAPDFEELKTLSYLLNGFASELDSLSTSNTESSNTFGRNLPNSARIILVTCLVTESVLNYFKKRIKTIFEEHNQMSQKSREIISNLDVILINTVPSDHQTNWYFKDDKKTQMTSNLSFTVHSILSGSTLAAKLINLAFDYYYLASTTVSGIPMKEEQNAGSSANYDVEIVHSKKAHTQFMDSGVFGFNFNSFFTENKRDGQSYPTLILKWCTPKSSPVDINYCLGAHRITAVDVNSRPSSCLINFLHTGKTVNLEMPRIKNTKILSHMLQSHNGELFIHVLSSTRSLIEDPPSISEGVGGRITDYRITEFADFMRKHRLVKMDSQQGNLEQAREKLKKTTLYWPISYGFTVFFNIRDQFHTFYQLISKDKITEQEVTELRNIIFNLAGNESKGLALPIQSNVIRSKGLKKEDHYRILWSEMEHIVRCFNESPQHQAVLQCLLDCKPKNDVMPNLNMNAHSTNGGHVTDANGTNDKLYGTKINLSNIMLSNESLQSLFVTKVGQRNAKRRPEFYGRTAYEGKIAKLYTELDAEK